MRSKEEILKAIENIEKTWTVENVPDFVRGEYTILKWMLEGEEEK